MLQSVHMTQAIVFESNTHVFQGSVKRGVTNCCQISYTPTEILFEINEITRFLKSEIKKIVIEASKIS